MSVLDLRVFPYALCEWEEEGEGGMVVEWGKGDVAGECGVHGMGEGQGKWGKRETYRVGPGAEESRFRWQGLRRAGWWW